MAPSGPEALELASCFALSAPAAGPAEAVALRHGFVHLCCGEVAETARARRTRSCAPRLSSTSEEEDLAFERYVATFHFRRSSPPADPAKLPAEACDFRAPTRTRQALEKLTKLQPDEPWEREDATEDYASTAASTLTPTATDYASTAASTLTPTATVSPGALSPASRLQLRADAPTFVPRAQEQPSQEAVALSTAPPPGRWPFLLAGAPQPTEAGARVPPPPSAPPLLAALRSPGPPPVPAGDPQVACFSPARHHSCKRTVAPPLFEAPLYGLDAPKVNLEDRLERWSLVSHASSTTAPPSVAEDDVASPASTYLPVDFAR